MSYPKEYLRGGVGGEGRGGIGEFVDTNGRIANGEIGKGASFKGVAGRAGIGEVALFVVCRPVLP